MLISLDDKARDTCITFTLFLLISHSLFDASSKQFFFFLFSVVICVFDEFGSIIQTLGASSIILEDALVIFILFDVRPIFPSSNSFSCYNQWKDSVEIQIWS